MVFGHEAAGIFIYLFYLGAEKRQKQCFNCFWADVLANVTVLFACASTLGSMLAPLGVQV